MEENIQHFIVPKKILSKFIQLYICGEPFFRHGAFEETNHSGLLENAVEEFGVIPTITGPENPENDTYISASGEEYELVGAGTMFYNGLEISLYGLSPYDIGPNKEHLEKLKDYAPKEIKFIINS